MSPRQLASKCFKTHHKIQNHKVIKVRKLTKFYIVSLIFVWSSPVQLNVSAQLNAIMIELKTGSKVLFSHKTSQEFAFILFFSFQICYIYTVDRFVCIANCSQSNLLSCYKKTLHTHTRNIFFYYAFWLTLLLNLSRPNLNLKDFFIAKIQSKLI